MNFWKVCLYFWAVMFTVFFLTFLLTSDFDNLWRAVGTIFMIFIFAMASALTEDKKLLRR
jgi:hypothetical protein